MTLSPDTCAATLAAWQRKRLDTVHRGRTDYGMGDERVTVLAYYWGADAAKPDTEFYRIESAFRETWLSCGMMKSVIVTDKITPEMTRFAAKFPMVEIQVEPELKAGSLYSMSIDCDSRLYKRFATPYVLIIQDDGFPLRKGNLADYMKWDFIGAPYVRDKFPQRLIARLLNYWVMNGGFSFRSRRCCELAAELWPRFSALGNCKWTSEDIYYTETLIRKSLKYHFTMNLAGNRAALRFSWDGVVPFEIKELPFGFHRAVSFAELAKQFPELEIGDER